MKRCKKCWDHCDDRQPEKSAGEGKGKKKMNTDSVNSLTNIENDSDEYVVSDQDRFVQDMNQNAGKASGSGDQKG